MSMPDAAIPWLVGIQASNRNPAIFRIIVLAGFLRRRQIREIAGYANETMLCSTIVHRLAIRSQWVELASPKTAADVTVALSTTASLIATALRWSTRPGPGTAMVVVVALVMSCAARKFTSTMWPRPLRQIATCCIEAQAVRIGHRVAAGVRKQIKAAVKLIWVRLGIPAPISPIPPENVVLSFL